MDFVDVEQEIPLTEFIDQEDFVFITEADYMYILE